MYWMWEWFVKMPGPSLARAFIARFLVGWGLFSNSGLPLGTSIVCVCVCVAVEFFAGFGLYRARVGRVDGHLVKDWAVRHALDVYRSARRYQLRV